MRGKAGDLILRATLDGAFYILDGTTGARLNTAPCSLSQALAFARQRGAKTIYQQPVDERGRVMGEPAYLLRVEAAPAS